MSLSSRRGRKGQDRTRSTSALSRAIIETLEERRMLSTLGQWQLEEGSGTTTADGSGNSHVATLNGGTSWDSIGHNGKAIDLDGYTGYLSVASASGFNVSGAVSVSAWIKLDSGYGDCVIAGNQDNTAGGYKLAISGGKLEFEVRDSSNGSALNRGVSGGTVLSAGTWYHVAGVYSQSAGSIKTYVNGSLDRTLSTSAILAAGSGSLAIGKSPYASTQYLLGELDNISVKDVAMSATDVADEFNSTAPNAPLSPAAIPDDGQVTVSWNSSASATSYNLFRSTTSGAEGATPLATGITAANYTDSGLTNGTRYYYTVSAVNAAGESPASAEVHARPNPAGSPVSSWQFTENTGSTTADAMATERTASLNGGVSWSGDSRSGSALSFDGYTGYLNAGSDSDFNITGAVTVSAWVKLADATAQQKIASNESGSGGGFKLGISGGKVEFEVSDAGGATYLNRSVSGGTVLQPAVWYHVVGVYSQSDGTISTYVDGVLDRTMSTSGILTASTANLIIGREATGGVYFNGAMDDVRIYNQALSSTDITTILSGERPATATGLAATTPASGEIDLSWTAVGGADSYNVYRAAYGSSFSSTPYATGVTSASFADTGLGTSQRYTYAVSAVNTIGEGDLSAAVSAGAPTAPTSVVLTPAGGMSVEVKWAAGTSDATSIAILISSDGGATYSQIATAASGQSSILLNDLDPGQTIQVMAQASNAYGSNASSASNSLITPYTVGGNWFFVTFESPTNGTMTIGETSYAQAGGTLASESNVTPAFSGALAGNHWFQGYVQADDWRAAVYKAVTGSMTVPEEGQTYTFPSVFSSDGHFQINTVEELRKLPGFGNPAWAASLDKDRRVLVLEDSTLSWNLDHNDDYILLNVKLFETPPKCPCEIGDPNVNGTEQIQSPGPTGSLSGSSAGFGQNNLGAGSTGDTGFAGSQSQQPYLQLDGDGRDIALFLGGGNNRFFQYSGGSYLGQMGIQDTLTHSGTQFIFTQPDGSQIFFNDSTVDLALRGRTTKTVDAAGNKSEIISSDEQGRPTQMQYIDSGGTARENWLYSYYAGDSKYAMQTLTMQNKDAGGSWVTARTVDYDYYVTGDASGSTGDLKSAVTRDGAGNATGTEYYRYYTDSSGDGYKHGLKYVFGADSYARLTAAVGDVTAASDAAVAPYADIAYTYDSQRRVASKVVQGAGDSGASGGQGTYSYAYAASGNATGFNTWSYKTTETLPDGNQNITYSNGYDEPMLTVFKDTASGTMWGTYYQYDSDGRQILVADPSAVALPGSLSTIEAYGDLLHETSGNYQYLNDSSGLITLTDYGTSTTASSGTGGNVIGYVKDTKIERGETTTPILQNATSYFSRAGSDATIYPVASYTVYRNTDGTGAEVTSYGYTWQGTTTQMASETTSKPIISSGQNGPGTADTSTDVYDTFGRVIWSKDADGFLTYNAYDAATGALVKTIADVDAAQTSDFANLPSGWSTPTGGGLHLVTTYVVDNLGRTTEMTDPDGNVTYTVYKDAEDGASGFADEVRVYPGWHYDSAAGKYTTTGPVQVSRYNRPGSYSESLTYTAPLLTASTPDGSDAISASNLQTLSRSYSNSGGQTIKSDEYFSFAGLTYSSAADIGTLNTNYYRTSYEYDETGRQNKVLSPTGTISRTVYDGRDRALSTWIGTTDTHSGAEWTPATNTGNMSKVSENVYDSGGVGDGNLTQTTSFPGGSAANRVTQSFYDWRDRMIASKSGVLLSGGVANPSGETDGAHRPISYVILDNLGQATEQDMYDGDGLTITSTNGVPNQPSSTNRRAKTITYYDEQSRVYDSETFSVDPSTGTSSAGSLGTRSWFDHRGNVIKTSSPGGLISKNQYDGAGRLTKTFATDGGGDSTWADAASLTGDIVLSQSETQYDKDGNPIFSISKERFNDDLSSDTGELGNATTSPKARVSYSAGYYDLANRPITSLDVGTNGGSAYTRPAAGSIPAGSDTILRGDTAYNDAGWAETMTDPKGLLSKSFYDALGRTTKTVQNYVDGTPSADTDQTTLYTYDGAGHTLTMTADMPTGTNDQTTQYVYGVTTGGGNGITSNDLLATIKYPNKSTGAASTSASDQQAFTYDALGEQKTKTDQNGSVHTYSYDVLGRLSLDAVTTLGSGVDGSIRSLGYTYNTQGLPYQLTSYSDAAGTTVVNQVREVYNGLGQLTTEYQEHSGAVNTSTSPKVQYAYVEMAGGANSSRLKSMTYPNGRILRYEYSSGLDNTISRLSFLADDNSGSVGTHLEEYSYLGLGTVIKRGHPQDGVDLTMIKQGAEGTGDAGDQYTGLDRFGRVDDQRWINTATSTATDRFQYGYDRDSNPLYKNNLVSSVNSELYHADSGSSGDNATAYDGLNRLVNFQRGTLSSSGNNGSGLDTVATNQRTQGWTLDQLGNWSSSSTNGSSTSRTHNSQNEVTAVGSSSLTFDNDGNTTTDETGKQYVYDAWNHLKIAKTSGGITLETFTYDAAGRRIVVAPFTGIATDFYYTTGWQVAEERQAGVTKDQYVWSPVYVDALVERDRDADSLPINGLEERLYAEQDANYNTTALVNTSGTVVERVVYDPYGAATFLNADYSVKLVNASAYSNPYLSQGGRQDSVTGFVYHEHRDLSVTLGRWMQQDPAGYVDETSLYQFVDGSPLNLADPTGTVPEGFSKLTAADRTYFMAHVDKTGYFRNPEVEAKFPDTFEQISKPRMPANLPPGVWMQPVEPKITAGDLYVRKHLPQLVKLQVKSITKGAWELDRTGTPVGELLGSNVDKSYWHRTVNTVYSTRLREEWDFVLPYDACVPAADEQGRLRGAIATTEYWVYTITAVLYSASSKTITDISRENGTGWAVVNTANMTETAYPPNSEGEGETEPYNPHEAPEPSDPLP